MPPLKIGLALGSGAARGLSHIGVLAVLEREGIPIDMIAGTSIGAIIGVLYAQQKDTGWIKKLALDLSRKRFTFLADPSLSKTGIIRGRRIEKTLRATIGDTEFKDLRIPAACVATDIDSGEEIVIKTGLVWEGIRSSASVPVIFTVAEWEGRYLVDGSLVNPVPVSIVRAMGADLVIAVNVIPHREIKTTTEPNIFTVLMQTINIPSQRIINSSLAGADVIIEPQVEHIGYANFHQAEECIVQGEKATQDSIPEIRRHI
ncbi:patatin-like phospholipase family protein [Chloroflexota bacterium]